MKRTHSTMTAAELEAWRKRHGLTKEQAAARLGVSERMMYHMLAGRRISQTIALLCRAIDALKNLYETIG